MSEEGPIYEKGDRIRVKPNVHYQGHDLSLRQGTVAEVKSYIHVRFALRIKVETDDWQHPIKESLEDVIIPMLRYEIEKEPELEFFDLAKL